MSIHTYRYFDIAAVEQRSARQSHKLEVEGSNPSPATKSRAKATKGKIRTAGQDKDASRKTKVNPPDGVVSRLGAGRTAQDAAPSSDGGRVAIQGVKRGRPRITEPRPWEAEGISRAQWYRRQAEKRSKP